MTQAPTGLKKILSNMHQDIFIVHDSYAEILDFAVHNLSGAEMAETQAFLTDLLKEPIDLQKVRAIWSPIWKEIRIESDEELSEFLKTVRDRVTT